MKKILAFKKTLLLIFVCTILIVFACFTSAFQVLVFLEDNSNFKEGNIIHEITAYSDVRNVTIVDYFSYVETKDAVIQKEEFLGKEWLTVKIDIGDMKKGERKNITYKIFKTRGEAMIGGDTYYIEDEKHQLFPKKIEIIPINHTEINNKTFMQDKAKEENENYIILAILTFAVFTLVLLLKLKK